MIRVTSGSRVCPFSTVHEEGIHFKRYVSPSADNNVHYLVAMPTISMLWGWRRTWEIQDLDQGAVRWQHYSLVVPDSCVLANVFISDCTCCLRIAPSCTVHMCTHSRYVILCSLFSCVVFCSSCHCHHGPGGTVFQIQVTTT